MASPSSTTMKTSLVLIMLLSAVVASHGHQVACKNTCNKPIWVNDVCIDVNVQVFLEVKEIITLVIYDVHGKKHSGTYKCPADVKALEFLYVDLYVKVKITAIIVSVKGLLHSVLGGVTSILECIL